MKILVTGATGRVGRAIAIHLMHHHEVVGLDRAPSSTADFVGDLRDEALLRQALADVDVIVHAGALHAPHVGRVSDEEFESINVDATLRLATLAVELGVKRFVFTSTTALYGKASTPEGRSGWVDETLTPKPRTIYHRTKLAAEQGLEALSTRHDLPVTVLRMSRCFPEPADWMAVYRLTRGIDARDVALAHRLAIETNLPGFERFIVSGKTPFQSKDSDTLYGGARELIRLKCPKLATEFERRGWHLPETLDRVYDSSKAQRLLGWQPQHGWESVLQMLDEEVSEVLPVRA